MTLYMYTRIFANTVYPCIGTDVKCPGEAAGSGLLAIPASQLGLVKGTAVAISLIDAHAGGLGRYMCT